MKRSLFAVLAALALLLAAAPVSAAIPRLINFQGRLADSSGTPRVGQWTMVFGIYTVTSGGTACFSESQAVAVNSGLFNANIGSASGGIGAGCDFSLPYYLQITVGGEALSPRIALTAAAYAMRAQVADNSVLLGGLAPGNGAGQIPSNNGTLNSTLHADLLDNLHASDIINSTLGQVSRPLYQCPDGGLFSTNSCRYPTATACGNPPNCGAGCTGVVMPGACCADYDGCTAYTSFRMCSCTNLAVAGYYR